jgi:hypothetical protein
MRGDEALSNLHDRRAAVPGRHHKGRLELRHQRASAARSQLPPGKSKDKLAQKQRQPRAITGRSEFSVDEVANRESRRICELNHVFMSTVAPARPTIISPQSTRSRGTIADIERQREPADREIQRRTQNTVNLDINPGHVRAEYNP